MEAIGELHGVPQKIGQHFSLYFIESQTDFRKLYSEGYREKIPIVNFLNSMGSCCTGIIPVAQASIGQVYKVITKYGILAVKAKYPDIEKRMHLDFKILSWLLLFTKLLPVRHASVDSTVKNIERSIMEECNYINEFVIQQQFHQSFKDIPNIHIPKVYEEYSGENIIVSEWVEGCFLDHYLENANEQQRQQIFSLLFQFEITCLGIYGLIHADPHPGNFLIQEIEGLLTLNVLDFGNVVKLTNVDVIAIRRILLADYDDMNQLKQDLLALGFNEKILTYYNDILGDIITILLEPFYFNELYDFINWRVHYKMNTLLSSQEWDEPFEVPAKLSGIVRMFHGLYYYARKYRIGFNWYANLRSVLSQNI